jgi:tellurite resistance protein
MGYYYSYNLTHSGLGRSRLIKAATRTELQQKAEAQLRIWNDLYARQREANARRQSKANKAAQLNDALNEAVSKTNEAQQVLRSIRTTLTGSLARQPYFSWDDKRNHLPYPVPQPQVTYHEFPAQPVETDTAFAPHLGLLDKLVGPLHEKKVADAQKLYEQALADWQRNCATIGQNNDVLETDYLARITQWKTNKHAYEKAQEDANAAVQLKMHRYCVASTAEVTEYNTHILEQSEYPDFFEKSFDLDYNPVKRVLIVNYDLPSFDEFPRLDSVKYIKSKDAFSETNISNREATALYAGFAFQMCLRTVRELFSADGANTLLGVAFNGFVSATNPATGNVDRTCVLALNTDPKTFSALNLAKVDPEECFRGLGGRCSDPLEKYRPVKPAGAEESATTEEAAAWIVPLKQKVAAAGGILSLSVSELQQTIGTVVGKRASLGDSRSLVALLGDAGFAVEPDASLLAQSYRAGDAVSLYIPAADDEAHTSEAYSGATGVLTMCGLVTVADGRIDPSEADRTWECVSQAFQLSSNDRRRFDALLKALLLNSDCLWRCLPKVVSQLKPEFKEWGAEVAVYVGIRNGNLEPAERAALDRIFPAIDLPKDTQDRIIAKYATSSHEVTVLEADAQPAGEPIRGSAGGLKLDMGRVAAIAQETKEVVAKLSDLMDDKETKAKEQPSVTPVAAPTATAPLLNASYLPLYHSLLARTQWTKAEFNELATKDGLMPTAAVDVINAWADDALGDFLIDGDDPVIIHTELLPQAS